MWIRTFPSEPERRENGFQEPTGVANILERSSKPVDYFMLLFSLNLMHEIVRQTNRYAKHFVTVAGDRLRQHARARLWKPLTVRELKLFLATLFNLSLIRKSSIEEYWNSKLPSQSSSWFRKILSRNRFQNILKFVHVSDYRRIAERQQPGYDPSARFKPLLTYANHRFLNFFTPGKHICVYESLVASKGKYIMRQYIPSKASKYGIKFWILCDAATGYILQMFAYRGRTFDPTPRGQLQGTNVVLGLLRESNLLHKGYHVVCESFFCSLDLAKKLLQRGTHLTGTLRSNRPMPRTILNADLADNSYVYMRCGQMLCLAYRAPDAKKPVRLLSTFYPAQQMPNGKPKIVQKYNTYMGSVDQNDAINSAYAHGRKSSKVWKKVLIHIIHRILVNSYILYCKNTTDNPILTRLRYIQNIVESLSKNADIIIRPQRRQRRHLGIERLGGKKERDCCECSMRSRGGVRRRSRTVCRGCGKGLHTHCARRHVCACIEQ